MGAFEDVRFSAGTEEVARAMAACSGFTVVGGGDSASALEELHLCEDVDFLFDVAIEMSPRTASSGFSASATKASCPLPTTASTASST